MRYPVGVVLVLLGAATAAAQSESVLRQAFEGKTVKVKIDMPGTQYGVDVRPFESQPVDFRKLAENLKQYGTGVHQGQSIMVTKVHVKGDLIEFQLGGGGYGTFADLMQQPSTPTYTQEGKSQREKDIENELKHTTDPARKKALQSELDELRRQRNRDTALASSLSSQAEQQKQANERELRARSGSRFNIRVKGGMPPSLLTPDGVRQALAAYLEFAEVSPADVNAPGPSAPAVSPGGTGTLRKGLTLAQVEQILGPARTASASEEGTLEVATREYRSDGQKVTAKFVGGVLVDYSITPE